MLYFGTRYPGGLVSDSQWKDFLKNEITPRFPKGLAVLTASGQWQSASGDIIREPAYVLHLIHTANTSSENAITEIIRAYKERFQQESVLHVRSQACVSF